jgi:hypothetical protein
VCVRTSLPTHYTLYKGSTLCAGAEPVGGIVHVAMECVVPVIWVDM